MFRKHPNTYLTQDVADTPCRGVQIVLSQMRRDRGQGIAMRRYRVVSNEFSDSHPCASPFSA